MLSFFELKQVAELVHHPGYLLLLDSIQAYVDDISSELMTAPPGSEQQILAKWRAASEILNLLKRNPENIAMEVKHENDLIAQTTGPQMPERYNSHVPKTLSPEQINALRAVYERKLKDQ